MRYPIAYLTDALKTARANKKLSQRALARRTGMPQAQISKIENAGVDPRVSTLIELARALDLEVILAPRERLPAIRGLIRTAGDASAQRPAYALEDEADDD